MQKWVEKIDKKNPVLIENYGLAFLSNGTKVLIGGIC